MSNSTLELAKALAQNMTMEAIKGFALIGRSIVSPVYPKSHGDQWWQKPGFGVQYQIEYRPGWAWNRDFNEFSRSMTDEDGRLKFNGPFCKVDEWVRLSQEVGVDYHMFETKWHDGICYFSTELTDWKTETDYTAQFTELSRSAGIPLQFYYSSIFDHNPQFDPIQPNPLTMSFIGRPGNQVYDDYIRGHYREIMEQYNPDSMWIDWYWPDQATDTTIDFFLENYPDVVLSFNMSSLQQSSHSRLHYTSGEAHALDGHFVKIAKEPDGSTIFVFSSAWKWSTLNRRMLKQPWELITPAGKWWQDPSLRDDPYDLLRMGAIAMASGGKLITGVTAQMDGSVYPDQVKQLKIFGEWYGPRRRLFSEAVPMRYRHREPRGVRVSPASIKTVASESNGNILLHLVNMDGATRPVELVLTGKPWSGTRRIVLEPSGRELQCESSSGKVKALIGSEDVDRVDTILRLES